MLKKKMILNFGNLKGDIRDERDLEIISNYLLSKNLESSIDEITWNDLAMNRIYSEMNITNTNIGDEFLFALLHKLEFSDSKLKEREKLIELFDKNSSLRVNLQLLFYKIGRIYNYSVYDSLMACKTINIGSIIPHYLILVSIFLSAITMFYNLYLGIFFLVCSLVISMINYGKTKKRIEMTNIWGLKYLAKIIKIVPQICKMNCPDLEEYIKELEKTKKIFKGMGVKTLFLSSGAGLIADSFDLVFDYVRIITHVDIITLYYLSKNINKNFNILERLYEIIGLFESMIAVASYRRKLPYYSKPNLLNDNVKLSVNELYHPLIDKPITNSIDTNESVLITGSNASGKSTFLKAIAINAILSQTIFLSTTKRYDGNYFKIYTSMALTDNLFKNESYFIVEIKSIKRILDNLNAENPVLCCIDEVLRGTNTLERIAASSEILTQFARNNALCFAATHDIELGSILESCFINYNFSENIIDGNIIFNYKINHGVARTRNAIKLLDLLGYSDKLVNNANERLDYFVKNGIWNS